MGIIAGGTRLIKPAYEFILSMAPKVHTYGLQREMENFIWDCFEVLKPLSRKYKEVCEANNFYGYNSSHMLCIGEWLRIKYRYQTYGSPIASKEGFFKCIRKYGDKLKPHVRRPIKNDFATLVDLAKGLKPYNDVFVKLEIPTTMVHEVEISTRNNEGKFEITSLTLNGIGMKTERPWTLVLFNGEEHNEASNITRDITSESELILYEDIIDYIVELFKKADAEVVKVRGYNKKIISQMKDIVEPLRIAKSLKG